MNQGLRATFEKFGDAPALLSQDKQVVTFGRLGEMVTSFSVKLNELGVRPGQRVAPIVENTVVRLALFMAVWRLGGELVLTDDPKRPMARGIVVDHVIAGSYQPVIDGPQWHIFQQDWMDLVQGPGPVDAVGSATIFGTSGSTGLPKYMSQTTDHWFGLTQQYADASTQGQNAFLVTYPPATTAFVLVALMSLYVGKGICLPCGPIEDTLQAAHDFGANGLHGPPAVMADVATAAEKGALCPKFTYIRAAGGATGPDLLERLYQQFGPVVMALGAANETQVFSRGLYDGTPVAPGWAGTMMPHVTYELRDQEHYQALGKGAGRLAIKVPEALRVHGYIGGEAIYDADGWAEIGDIVSVDEAGTVHFLGRDDFLINIGGGKFAPELIEAKVASQPGVIAAGAAPIRTAEGDNLALALVLKPDADLAAITAFVKKMIVVADALHVTVVDRLPLLPSGKLDRPAIATQATT